LAIDSFEKAPAFSAVGHVDDPAPQRELADRIGEEASGDGKAGLNRGFGPLLVSREENLEWCVVRDLGEEGAGCAETQDGVIAGLLLEQSRNLLRRLGEVGGDGDVGLGGLS
jgi:hypothetical protein